MAAAKALGKNQPMFVTGEPKYSCRLKNEKAEEGIRELDCKFASAKKHITLLVDNCLSHNKISYKVIDLSFLPPNTSSKLQLIEQCVIRLLKAKYRHKIVWTYIRIFAKRIP